MPIPLIDNINCRSAQVLDDRTAGSSTETDLIDRVAVGLLRYETDMDNWVYYKDNNVGWVNLSSNIGSGESGYITEITAGTGLSANTDSSGSTTISLNLEKSENWNTAYSWGDHSLAGYLTSSSITNVLRDTNFTQQSGIMTRNGPGLYGVITDGVGFLKNDGSGGLSYTGISINDLSNVNTTEDNLQTGAVLGWDGSGGNWIAVPLVDTIVAAVTGITQQFINNSEFGENGIMIRTGVGDYDVITEGIGFLKRDGSGNFSYENISGTGANVGDLPYIGGGGFVLIDSSGNYEVNSPTEIFTGFLQLLFETPIGSIVANNEGFLYSDGSGNFDYINTSAPGGGDGGGGEGGYVSYYLSDISSNTEGGQSFSSVNKFANFGNTVIYTGNNFEFVKNGNYKISISGLFRSSNSSTSIENSPTIFVSYSTDGQTWVYLKDFLYLKNVAESNATEKPFNTLASDGIIEVANSDQFKLRVDSENFVDHAECKNFRIDFMNIGSVGDEGGYVSYYLNNDITLDTSNDYYLNFMEQNKLAKFGNIVSYVNGYFEFTKNGNYKISISGLLRSGNYASEDDFTPTVYVSYSTDGQTWEDLKDVIYLKNIVESNTTEKPFNTLASDGIIEVANSDQFKLRVRAENFGVFNPDAGAICRNFRIDFMRIGSDGGLSGKGYIKDSDIDGSGGYILRNNDGSYITVNPIDLISQLTNFSFQTPPLSNILANDEGFLRNDGSGNFSYENVSGAGASTIGGLDDVEIADLANGDILIWSEEEGGDSENGHWGNQSFEDLVEQSLTEYVKHSDVQGAGIITRTGFSNYSTIQDNSENWNEAYNWGDHSLVGYLTSSNITNVLKDQDFEGAGIMIKTSTSNYDIVAHPTQPGFLKSDGSGGLLYASINIDELSNRQVSAPVYEDGAVLVRSSGAAGGGEWRTSRDLKTMFHDWGNHRLEGYIKDSSIAGTGVITKDGSGDYRVIQNSPGFLKNDGSGGLSYTGISINDLSNVNITENNLQTGAVLGWDGSGGNWITVPLVDTIESTLSAATQQFINNSEFGENGIMIRTGVGDYDVIANDSGFLKNDGSGNFEYTYISINDLSNVDSNTNLESGSILIWGENGMWEAEPLGGANSGIITKDDSGDYNVIAHGQGFLYNNGSGNFSYQNISGAGASTISELDDVQTNQDLPLAEGHILVWSEEQGGDYDNAHWQNKSFDDLLGESLTEYLKHSDFTTNGIITRTSYGNYNTLGHDQGFLYNNGSGGLSYQNISGAGASTISDLDDVQIIQDLPLEEGHILVWSEDSIETSDDGHWQNKSFDDLLGESLTEYLKHSDFGTNGIITRTSYGNYNTLGHDQGFLYNNGSGNFSYRSSTIGGLDDVDGDAPVSIGDVLSWDGSGYKWKPDHRLNTLHTHHDMFGHINIKLGTALYPSGAARPALVLLSPDGNDFVVLDHAQGFIYNDGGGNFSYENVSGAGASTIGELDDVDVTSNLENGNILVWSEVEGGDSESGQWENQSFDDLVEQSLTAYVKHSDFATNGIITRTGFSNYSAIPNDSGFLKNDGYGNWSYASFAFAQTISWMPSNTPVTQWAQPEGRNVNVIAIAWPDYYTGPTLHGIPFGSDNGSDESGDMMFMRLDLWATTVLEPDLVTNIDTTVYEVLRHGFRVNKAGYFKLDCTLFLIPDANNRYNIAMQFGKKAASDDHVSEGADGSPPSAKDANFSLIGVPVATGYVNEHNSGTKAHRSQSIDHIVYLDVGDEVALFTTGIGNGGALLAVTEYCKFQIHSM